MLHFTYKWTKKQLDKNQSGQFLDLSLSLAGQASQAVTPPGTNTPTTWLSSVDVSGTYPEVQAGPSFYFVVVVLSFTFKFL